jgi:hypothetical protein
LLRWIYYHDEPAANQLKTNINFGELQDSIDIVLDKVIENQIAKIGSWRKKLNALANTSMSLNLQSINEYKFHVKETIARRNLIIHNRGTVNMQYLNELKGTLYFGKFKVDDIIETDMDYFNRAVGCIEKLSVTIESNIKKYYKDHIKE